MTLFIIRKFLNKRGHETTASIYARIDYDKWNIDTVFEISDCTHKIALDMVVEEKGQLANTLFKIDTLIDSLQRFRAYLIIVHNEFQKIRKDK